MTTQTDIQRYLDDWLGTTPMEPADRVVVAVAVRIRRERQRPTWWFGWQLDRPRTLVALVATAALLLLLGIAAIVSGPQPVPEPSASPDPSRSTSTARQVDPGLFASTRFPMPFTYSLGDGWWSIADTPTVVTLARDEGATTGRIDVYYDAFPANADAAGCLEPVDWDRAPDTASIAEELRSHPALVPDIGPTGLDVLAGVGGTILVRESFESTCGEGGFGSGTIRTTAFPVAIIRAPSGEPFVISIQAGEFVDLRFLDDGGGTFMVVVARGDETFRALADSVARTMAFPGGPVVATLAPPVAPGRYAVARFGVPLQYDLPNGWLPTLDSPDSFVLGTSDPAGATIELVRGAYSVARDPSGCLAGNPADPAYWDRPHRARDFVAGLRADDDYAVVARPVDVGGLRGFDIEVTIDETASVCPATDTIFLYVIRWSDGGFIFNGSGAGETSTLTAVTDPDGKTLVIKIRGGDPSSLAEAARIVESFELVEAGSPGEQPAPS